MRRRWDGVFAAIIAMAGGCGGAAAQQPAAPPCGGADFARGAVSRVIDGRTFALDDGREVRLAVINVPPLEAQDPAGAAAKAALDALLGGDEVVLRKEEFPDDRYGRISA